MKHLTFVTTIVGALALGSLFALVPNTASAHGWHDGPRYDRGYHYGTPKRYRNSQLRYRHPALRRVAFDSRFGRQIVYVAPGYRFAPRYGRIRHFHSAVAFRRGEFCDIDHNARRRHRH